MNSVQTLTRYKAWADDIFLSVLENLSESQLNAADPSFFGNIIRTLNHSYAMDFVWKCHLLGEPHGLTTRNPADHPSIRELVTVQREIGRWYVNFADSLTPDQLREVIEFQFIGGGLGNLSREDIFLHVVNHTTYHRGNIAVMLYHLGIVPPATDLPIFHQALART